MASAARGHPVALLGLVFMMALPWLAAIGVEWLVLPTDAEITLLHVTPGEVAEAAAELLVAARDGDRSRLGPASLGPATRFVVDHAPCPVLLVWPDQAPGVESIPPPPPRPTSITPLATPTSALT